jgi:glycosyltransferase involved in cell wall biosynthesis
VHLLHDQLSEPSAAKEYASALGVPDFFDTDTLLDGRRHAEARATVGGFLEDLNPNVVHMHSYPRVSQIKWLSRQYPLVATVHVPLCPNGARYRYKSGCACDRAVGVGCFTKGYLRDGCGRLGDGTAMSPHGFLRAMFDDGRRRRAFAGCAALVVPSRWMADRLAADGFDPSALHVIPPPIDQLQVDGGTPPPASPPAILFVGRLVSVKGLPDLLHASSGIPIPHQVWVVGDGPERPAMEQLAAKLGIAQRVTFYGNLSPGQIAPLRNTAAVAVVPSRWPETFAMVGPEAMAAGLPVVAYRSGGVTEWLDEGRTGFGVDVGDVKSLANRVAQLLSRPELSNEMAAAARATTGKWSTQAHLQKIINLYASLHTQGTRPAQGAANLSAAHN